MNDLKQLIQQFMPFAQEKMGFDRPPRLFLRQDAANAENPLGKTGFYDPQAESITIYVSSRHPKDVLRSLSHELMHHTQKCNGEFENTEGMGEQGYAQNNEHMRNMEIEAYQASIVFRDWEDSLKETIYYEHLQKGVRKPMSTKNWKNRELNGLLMERFGFGFNPLDEEEEIEERTKRDTPDRVAGRDTSGRRLKALEEEEIEEGAAVAEKPEEEEEEEEEYVPAGLSHAAKGKKAAKSKGDAGAKARQRVRGRSQMEETADQNKKPVTDEQIREVAQRVIKRLKETKQNG